MRGLPVGIAENDQKVLGYPRKRLLLAAILHGHFPPAGHVNVQQRIFTNGLEMSAMGTRFATVLRYLDLLHDTILSTLRQFRRFGISVYRLAYQLLAHRVASMLN